MHLSQFFKSKQTVAAVAAILFIPVSTLHAAPAIYNSATQILKLDAVDVQESVGLDTTTFSANLKLISSDPIQFELQSAKGIKQPGGQRAFFHKGNNLITLPGVAIDDVQEVSAEMQLIPGSSPLRFRVTSLKDISGKKAFNRIASFPVYLNTDVDIETVAEIVDFSKDGYKLIYTDGVAKKIGFVDIKNPADPKALGAIDIGGEPTSVAVLGDYALAAVNTSTSFTEPSGELKVIDIASQTIIASYNIGGQPDSIAISPDGKYAAVIIENERDEDFETGEPPQAPAGFLVIVDLSGPADQWILRPVDLVGITDLFPTDPEPEFVDINTENVAVVTFQENNYIALVDLKTGTVTHKFSAGTTNLTQIDTEEEKPALISLTGSIENLPREPDGVTWLTNNYIATADEGDLFGGSRGFTIFNTSGDVVFDAGNTLDHEAVRLGHYPDGRSGNKGNEPENIDVGKFGNTDYIFVASERANIVFVYRINAAGNLEKVQTLPAGVGPEGIKVFPARNLFVTASEVDAREDKIRSLLTIYQLQSGGETYPKIKSANRADGTPIPWSALSGLAIDKTNKNVAYSIHDSFYQQSRIYAMDISKSPAIIYDEIIVKDTTGKLAAVAANQVNTDQTVNLDLEGISISADGGFWLASEGAGTEGDATRPVTSKNLLIHVTSNGEITQVVSLPDSTNNRQVRFGFEGVASTGTATSEVLFVAFQREWKDDLDDHVRIGRYDVAADSWTYFYYPLDVATSPAGGWIGLSEITAINDQEFIVIERDNQGNTDARVKRLYRFSVAGLTPLTDATAGTAPAFPTVVKTLVKDLMPNLEATGGMVLEKIEGMAISGNDILVVNDNDGIDDSSGETQLIRLENLLK